MSRKYFLLRPKPGGSDRLEEFREKKFCAIGWSDIGDLKKIKKIENNYIEPCKIAVEKAYPKWQSWQIASAATALDTFVNLMEHDDILVIPDYDKIHFAKITGDYYFEEEHQKEDYANQRKIEFLKMVKRESLPERLKNALKVRYIIANFKDYKEEIETILNREEEIGEENTVKLEYEIVTYPVRPGIYAKVQIPKDMSKKEAERLADSVRTLYFND